MSAIAAQTQMTPTEMAMRSVLLVQEWCARDPDFTLTELALRLRDRFQVSRPTSYRLARKAVDTLGLHYIEVRGAGPA